ncbi:hypothetical protein DFJ73DRAFT_776548 [Zopfochytrium polystomum]|nr:hypothetical protein DFJ73DRAFT_776548 [Zopfochytrium polystomum]
MTKVLIIGGGVAGPALALMLKRRGFDVALYDRIEVAAADTAGPFVPPDVGGGLNLQQNMLRVLDRLGILDEVIASGTAVPRIDMLAFDGSVIASFDMHNDGKYVTVDVLRSSLARIIHRELAAAGVRMHTGKHLADVKQHTDVFRDGTTASGDILVGADGVHSAVRRAVLPPDAQPRRTDYLGYLGVSSYSPKTIDWDSEGLTFLMDTHAGKSAFAMRTGRDTIQWAMYETRPDELAAENADWHAAADLAAERARMRVLADRWRLAPWFSQIVDESLRIIPVAFYRADLAPTAAAATPWHAHNTVLLGDAVHAMVPFAGQGAAMAIEDAEVLAEVLAAMPDLAAPGQAQRAFALYQEIRWDRVKKVSAAADSLGKSMNENSPSTAFVGQFVLKLFAFVARVTGMNLNSKEITNYDARDTAVAFLSKKGYPVISS